jgi:hypothetical protein
MDHGMRGHLHKIISEEMMHKQPRCQSRQTIPWGMPQSIEKYNRNEQRQWICGSIGYETENANNNLNPGGQANSIMLITGQSIIQPPIVLTFARNFYHHSLY